MKLSQLIKPESIFIGWPGGDKPAGRDKWTLIRDLTRATCAVYQYSPELTETALAGVVEREKSMTTGIGLGVAIPHASLSNITQPIGALCLIPEGVEFNAIDNQPVQIIILILVPKNEFQRHIRTLASIARLMNDEAFRRQLSTATSPQEAYELIVAGEQTDFP